MRLRTLLGRSVVAFAALLGLQAAASPLDLLAQKLPPGEQHIAYGTAPEQYGLLRVPPGTGPFPVVMLIHGGCWSVRIDGFPEGATALDLLRPLASALTQTGYATWNVEYRRVGSPGGGWPGTFADLNAATQQLQALAAAHHLDLHRAIVAGHSSGGQLAAWLASEPRSRKSEIRASHPFVFAGLVDLDGPPTLTDAPLVIANVCGDAVPELLGATPAERPERYRDASAVLPMGVPQELFTAGSFGRAWADLSLEYAAKAAKAGDRARVHTEDAADHFDIVDPQSRFWTAVRAAFESLVSTR